ncbi:uncharacterized protein LOC143283165 isoform X2 [Babylonia areolata]|uniref:uncharacterized protein LOC143283165 isoform X2 n=1 Tax=Babylonia areolata TaxID=304850 RepID=UPI003FCFC006
MDHLGYRVATLAGLPADCPLSRVRLAEAGFHWDPSVSRQAVVCHGCPVVYSLQQAPGAPGPLRVHVDGSPQCPVVTAVCGRLCWAGSASSASSPSSSVGSGSSTSVSASLTTGGGGGRGGEDAREPGPDGEGQSGERSDASTTTITNTTITNTTVAQRPDSQPSLTGYVLALAGSDMDQRLEPSLPPSPSPFPGPSPSPPAAAAAASPSHSDSRTDRRGGPLSLGGAVYPHYSTSQARHLTFRAFPTAMAAAFPAEVMVSLGFFYAGYADCVRCFYCGVGLKSWAPSDDPLAEHVRWRPDCRFLLATKGRQCIQRLLRQINGPSEAPAVSGVRGVHERSSGGSGGSESPAQGPQRVSLGQQLVTMGFAVKDIQSARARLRTAGSPEDLDHYLQILLT